MKRGTSLRRMLVSGLLLSLGVWAADQLWGRGAPKAASAVPPSGAAAVPGNPAPAGGATSADVRKALPLATRLLPRPYASLAERLASVPRDPFTPSPFLDALLNPAPAPAPAAALPPVEDHAAAFRAGHQLEGVVIGPQALAVVNGQVLRVGAMLDGWQLVRVERERVTFRKPGEKLELVLVVPEPRTSGTDPPGGGRAHESPERISGGAPSD